MLYRKKRINNYNRCNVFMLSCQAVVVMPNHFRQILIFKYIDKGTVALDFQNFICVQFRKLQNSSKSLYPTGVTGLAFSRDLKCVTLKRVVACSPNNLPRCRIRTGDPLPCWSLNYCTSSVGLTS